jgi:hypothetical protein
MLFRFFGLVVLGLALSVSPALADPPVVESIPVDETLVLPAGTDGNPCAFDVTLRQPRNASLQDVFRLERYANSTDRALRWF